MISSILLLLALVIKPTSIWGRGGTGFGADECVGLSGSLSVVVFQALSSPVSANTNRLLGRRFSILFSDIPSYESFELNFTSDCTIACKILSNANYHAAGLQDQNEENFAQHV